ncbi:hypothetical protein R3W88_024866 [Solanum pinnatisectum]|uniref:Uncharacterized protein n=1 Tax=Solanum pinnatisectum TaxID=50273 RepID=A0AAV9M290_9SOLN|nr:hypothetical protein R3W88_024866 [Solanum pinnatisectum]
MSILSKTWSQAWLTLPYLEFIVSCWQGWEGHTKKVDAIMERYGKTLLNSCPFIASFIVENCSGMKVLKIKSDSLKVLKIHQYCECDIDAPNLVSLDYRGGEIPELNIARESSLLKNSKIIFSCLPIFSSLNTHGFIISICLFKCDEINMADLQMDHIGSTGWVDVLNLNMLMMSQIIECPTFVDALLWSCHPGRLNLISIDIETVTCLIDRLMCRKNSDQLNDIKAFDVKNQSLQLGSEELAKRITEGEQLYFILDW